MLSRLYRDRMRSCADLLPPPGGHELKTVLVSHVEADARIERLEAELLDAANLIDHLGGGSKHYRRVLDDQTYDLHRKFKGIALDGPEARLTCSECGGIFDVDPSTEENLVLKKNDAGHNELFAKCPGCGAEER